MSNTPQDLHNALKTLIKAERPFFFGTVDLPKTETKLFYRSPDGSNGVVDFLSQEQEAVTALANACQPASFGMGGQDVLDETYRKAGKMDVENFSAQFAPSNHGLVHLINDKIFQSLKRDIRMEPYKLNVYGPGSFFKPHVDTPRGSNMFGSLVVVFPTLHEGGALVCRHEGSEESFDSAKEVDPSERTSELKAGFAFFYSDVEHEVLPVISGYRVTLTYNLYFIEKTAGSARAMECSTAVDIERHLKALLDKSTILPEGGLLGFKLSHKYPIRSNMSLRTYRDALKRCLKGVDAHIMTALEALRLDASFKIFYDMGEDDYESDPYKLTYMFDHILEDDAFSETHGDTASDFAEQNRGINVRHCKLEDCYRTDEAVDDNEEENYRPTAIPVHWVNEIESATNVKTEYTAYGNEATTDYFYGEIAIVAGVGPKGYRVN